MNHFLFKPGWVAICMFVTLFVACQRTEPQVPSIMATIPIEIGAPVDIVINSQTGYVYVMNRGNRVGVLKELEQVALLETDEDLAVRPNDMAVDEERNWVYVVNIYGNTIAVIRDTEVIAVVEATGQRPHKVAVEPNSGWAYIVGSYLKDLPGEEPSVVEGHVTVLEGPELVGTLSLGNMAAKHVVADPIEGYVYIFGSQRTDNSPIGAPAKGVVIVLQGLTEVARYDVLVLPSSTDRVMDVDPNTGDVFVVNGKNLVQFSGGELVRDFPIMEKGAIRHLHVHPQTGDVYLVNWGPQSEVIVVRGRRVIGRVHVSASPLKMAIDPITGNVYVADFWFNTLAVIHGTDLVATLETGWYPYGIGVNPANGRVYISNTNEGTITVLGIQPES